MANKKSKVIPKKKLAKKAEPKKQIKKVMPLKKGVSGKSGTKNKVSGKVFTNSKKASVTKASKPIRPFIKMPSIVSFKIIIIVPA